jgi:predicted transcriptional regulator
MKPRLSIYISPAVEKQLGIAAMRPGVSKSAIVEAALDSFLSPDRDDHRDAALIGRIEQFGRLIERLRREQEVANETVALFILYFLTLTPPLPESGQDDAKALGRDRFDYFLKELAARMAGGHSLIRDTLDEIVARETDFFQVDGAEGEAVR